MKNGVTAALLIISLFILNACTKNGKLISGNRGKYNLVVTLYDKDIDDPANDRRSYYEVSVDKSEFGRTTIGLESQKKVFEARLTPDRHLVKVEKWILDESLGRYIKLNNLYQPKPNFIYVNIEEGKTSRVTVESTKYGTSVYKVTKE